MKVRDDGKCVKKLNDKSSDDPKNYMNKIFNYSGTLPMVFIPIVSL